MAAIATDPMLRDSSKLRRGINGRPRPRENDERAVCRPARTGRPEVLPDRLQRLALAITTRDQSMPDRRRNRLLAFVDDGIERRRPHLCMSVRVQKKIYELRVRSTM